MIHENTILTPDELAADYDRVAEYFEGELVAYRAKSTGLLRIIDVDSGGCIMGSKPFTKDIADAKRIANEKMALA